MAETRGLPLLSTPPPQDQDGRAEIACRKCSKEFNIIFTRARRCNHCGYSYCSSCSDYQALMPRSPPDSGYTVMPVCAFCIELLSITATPAGRLRSFPVAKLRKYVDAYNIRIDPPVEKDVMIDAIVAARGINGCLSPAREEYYRKYSVPNRNGARPRGLFSRLGQDRHPSASQQQPAPPAQSSHFERPDLEPSHPRYNRDASQQHPPSSYSTSPPRSTQRSQPNARPQPQQHTPNPQTYQQSHPRPQQPRPQSTHAFPQPRPASAHGHTSGGGLNVPPSYPSDSQESQQPRPRATSAQPSTRSPVPTPPAPVPTLDELMLLPESDISALSIGTLKAVLFANHVPARQVLEKGELVTKVFGLVADERREREERRLMEEREEAAVLERQRAMMEERRLQQEEQERKREQQAESAARSEGVRDGDTQRGGEARVSEEGERGSAESARPPPLPPKASPNAMSAMLERTGLCVICQDEEANIAIVDCGHLAMCRGCSDLIMSSSRECPLCRTRIVTEARLLRIFKT